MAVKAGICINSIDQYTWRGQHGVGVVDGIQNTTPISLYSAHNYSLLIRSCLAVLAAFDIRQSDELHLRTALAVYDDDLSKL